MIVKNKTKNTTLSTDAQFAESFLDKSLGLIRKQNSNKTLIFNTHFGIHTLCMKDPIDVLVLNDKGEVVKIKQNLTPNHFFFWNPKHSKVIELPKETITKSKTKIGDTIIISEKITKF